MAIPFGIVDGVNAVFPLNARWSWDGVSATVAVKAASRRDICLISTYGQQYIIYYNIATLENIKMRIQS
jgi:hypothetical protein